MCLHPPIGLLITSVLQRAHLSSISPAQRTIRRGNIQKRDWAHVVDVNKPMVNFHELVPEMAHKVTVQTYARYLVYLTFL